MRYWLAALLLIVAAAPVDAAPVVERTVLLMRHGIRPPTKAVPMPAGITPDAWPSWPVAPGFLTPHGAEAVRLAGAADRRASGIGPGCPKAKAVVADADSDQRTIATAVAWLEGFAPGCGLTATHLAQDVPDPRFDPIGAKRVGFDASRARKAIAGDLGPGGLAAADVGQRDALARLQRIYGCCSIALCSGFDRSPCDFTTLPSALRPGDGRPKLGGGIDLGSTAAQILLLEYADGKPMAEVGWGRASAADVSAVSSLHAAEFAILVRPRYVAARMIAPLARQMRGALTGKGPRAMVIVGHDSQIAALGGLLGLHWQVPGFARDDPAPGGAIGFELLRSAKGKQSVRAIYRSATLDELRDLKPPTYRAVLPIPGCGKDGVCPLATFETLLADRLKL